ncbi:MAG TPA: 1,2-phenylacetyl-CoA epoxidase subunit PaaD [Candidatus Sulfotelmatobacter sp.]|nr:1,2-phenylacetyl-CoA epoxidase subunit PaaD [Candidatus Sulfotelmatobacter sp.]
MVSAPVARAPAMPTVDDVWAALAGVPDPEIPAISIVDLGVVHHVTVGAGIAVELLPTFVGCPALDVIRDAVRARLAALAPDAVVDVRFTFAEPWTSHRITPAGREQLRRSGFAPPAPGGAALVQLMPRVACPYCGSRHTRLENAFGPTLCRATHYCTDCRQPFEAFKPV